MNRGAIRPTTRLEAVQRALSQIIAVPKPPVGAPADAGNRPIGYRNDSGKNGGFDPFAPHCASWSFGDRRPTADCVGLVCWAIGIDRMQPTFKGSLGVWLQQNSMMNDADGAQRFFAPVDYWSALPGDLLVDTQHVALIVRPAMRVPRPDPSAPVEEYEMVCVDSSPANARDVGAGASKHTGIGTSGPWSKACRVIRYKHYVGG